MQALMIKSPSLLLPFPCDLVSLDSEKNFKEVKKRFTRRFNPLEIMYITLEAGHLNSFKELYQVTL